MTAATTVLAPVLLQYVFRKEAPAKTEAVEEPTEKVGF
jgi:hypothetical protein